MNMHTLLALLALGVSVLDYIDSKEHREWERSRDRL